MSKPISNVGPSETEPTEYPRRHILAVGAGAGALMLSGCSTDTAENDPDGDGSSSDDTENDGSAAGTFRLLISDQPVAIDDFDELNVSFDRARIFSESSEQADDPEDGESDPESEEDDEGDEPENGDENETEDEPVDDENETEDEPVDDENETDADEPEDDEAADGGQDGFQVIDLDDATVDLTQVVGDKAIGVFEGNLEEGRYTKIELYATDVEGIVEGEAVDVKIPSGKLQIVKPFEVVAGETLSFVFDINVVKKGQQQAYNLLPVISESGVTGQDVEVEEIEKESQSDGSGSGTEDSEETDAEEKEDTDAQAEDEDEDTEEPTEDDAESG